MKSIIAIDTETTLMGPGVVCPRLICLSAAGFDPDHGHVVSVLYGNRDADDIQNLLLDLLRDDEVLLVGHNIAFDLAVIAQEFPDLIPLIFRKLEEGLVTDTKVREKLLNLSTHGKLDMLVAPDGSSEPIRYSLANLVLNYTGVDRSAEKQGDDIWRLNYESLDGLSAEDYPREAAAYAMQDAMDTLEVYERQAERIRGETGPGSVRTENFQTAVDFCLRLITCWGFAIDHEAKAEVEAMLQRELAPEKLDLLIESGILQPASPAQPYKNGAKNKDGTPKMRKAQPEGISKTLLQTKVLQVCEKNGLPVKETPKGGVSTDSEVLTNLAPLDETIAQYQHRQSLQKLVTTYLPVLTAPTIHPEFDVLKETGRTSSYGGKLYPSCNIQQVDPRVRQCYVPRPGHVLCSVDYQAIELASLAQKCYSLFGYSVHRDRINDGVDLHAYLGAQLAVSMDYGNFQTAGDPLDIYADFLDLKNERPDYYKHWRKFAKPVGLGYPGGMGVATFVTMARNSYGIQVDEETAQRMKDVWQETYPETVEYFDWVNRMLKDDANSTEDEPRYAYFSPLGMYRAGATYCAAANGAALQTPTAEGAKSAAFNVARACYDWIHGSVLFGARVVAFIHDELIVELPEDDRMHDRAFAIAQIMVDSMQRILPDVTIRAEPALMRFWSKQAEPVFDSEGRLQVWEPKRDKEAA